MPKFTPNFLGSRGVDLSAFQGIDRSMFPTIGRDPNNPGNVSPNFGVEQLASVDATQRVVTNLIGRNFGIPTLGDLAQTQLDFLASEPARIPSSEIARAFYAGMQGGAPSPAVIAGAVEKALDVINRIGLDALQGVTGVTSAVLDAVPVVPLIGGYVKMVGGLIQLAASTVAHKKWKTLKVSRPQYDPANDYNTALAINNVVPGRNWTHLFMPDRPDAPLTTGLTQGFAGSTFYPRFAGRRTEIDKEWLFAQWSQASPPAIVPPVTSPGGGTPFWGFIPQWGNHGGKLWRGILYNHKTGQSTLVGSQYPTSEALGMELWRAVFDPQSPQIFFVDAVAVGNAWLNYLVLLRRALHMSHTEDAFQGLKALKGDIYGSGTVQKRMWLSLSSIDKGDLKKKLQVRRAICNKLVPVFGWAQWSSRDDEMVGNLAKVQSVSDDAYIELFGLNRAPIIDACRALYQRQAQAAQSISVLYSKASDPAFRSDQRLRQIRARSMNALKGSEKLALVDPDMIEEGAFDYQATQLQMPGGDKIPQATDAVKMSTYRISDTWVGEGPAPATWTGNIPGAAASGGGGGGVAVLGAAAAAAYFFMGRP